jgi:DNA-binding NarL/FixJ family response regulator
MLLGVEGVVLKERTFQQLVGCIRKVYAGDQWLESSAVGRVVEKLLRCEVGARELTRGPSIRAIADRDQGLG